MEGNIGNGWGLLDGGSGLKEFLHGLMGAAINNLVRVFC